MKVAILGAGGLGKVILEALQGAGKHRVAGFLDDQVTGSFCGLPVLGKMSDLGELKRNKIGGICLAVGDRFLESRLKLIGAIRRSGLKAVSAVHRTAWISPSAKLGDGCYVGPMACVHSGACVGDFCVIWTATVIEHDNRIGENCFICPSVTTAGYTEIGRDVFIGMGAIIRRCRIGDCATIGAGSLALKDVKARTLIMGRPSKTVRSKTGLVYHN